MPPNDFDPPRSALLHTRGEDTRARILESALAMFAEQGYEGASTRELARRAGVNLPAIQYYFGSKEGLYHAVIDDIAAGMEAKIAPVTAEIECALASTSVCREEVLSLLLRMLEAFVGLVTDRSAPDWEGRALFFARAEIEPAAALDPLHERVTRRIVEPCAALVGRLIGQPADAEETLLRTVALIGQVIVFCNRKAQRVFGWDQADPRRVAAIQAVVRDHTAAIFAATREVSPWPGA